jgi:uncharacterized membrane protein YfcA
MTEAAIVGIVIIAGVFRGITGFGAAMLMTPTLSMLIGPVPAVVTTLILESLAALIMLPEILPKLDWRTLLPILVPAALTVPVGTYFLTTLNPATAQQIIAFVVVVCSVMLLMGLRYQGAPKPSISAVLGGLAGLLMGATSIGAPPVVIYLLSGPDPVNVTRANLTMFITFLSIAGLAMFYTTGAMTVPLASSAALLIIPFFIAIWTGTKLFPILREVVVRRIGIVAMLCIGIVTLLR